MKRDLTASDLVSCQAVTCDFSAGPVVRHEWFSCVYSRFHNWCSVKSVIYTEILNPNIATCHTKWSSSHLYVSCSLHGCLTWSIGRAHADEKHETLPTQSYKKLILNSVAWTSVKYCAASQSQKKVVWADSSMLLPEFAHQSLHEKWKYFGKFVTCISYVNMHIFKLAELHKLVTPHTEYSILVYPLKPT